MKKKVLVEANGIFLQGKHIVSKDNDLVIAPFMEANKKLASTEFVGIHCIQQDALLCLDGHIFPVEFWSHRAPHLNNIDTLWFK